MGHRHKQAPNSFSLRRSAASPAGGEWKICSFFFLFQTGLVKWLHVNTRDEHSLWLPLSPERPKSSSFPVINLLKRKTVCAETLNIRPNSEVFFTTLLLWVLLLPTSLRSLTCPRFLLTPAWFCSSNLTPKGCLLYYFFPFGIPVQLQSPAHNGGDGCSVPVSASPCGNILTPGTKSISLLDSILPPCEVPSCPF